jgi:preprotein translocase subunit SecE
VEDQRDFISMEATKAVGWPEQTKNYIEEVKAEMRRVTWPSWPQVRATTGVVIAAVFLFAAYFWVIDAVVNAGVTKLITSFTHK